MQPILDEYGIAYGIDYLSSSPWILQLIFERLRSVMSSITATMPATSLQNC